jgi:hypothetical protein
MPGIITLNSPPIYTVQSIQIVFGKAITWTLVDASGSAITVTIDLVANTYASQFGSGALSPTQIAMLGVAIPTWLTNSGNLLAGTVLPGTAS